MTQLGISGLMANMSRCIEPLRHRAKFDLTEILGMFLYGYSDMLLYFKRNFNKIPLPTKLDFCISIIMIYLFIVLFYSLFHGEKLVRSLCNHAHSVVPTVVPKVFRNRCQSVSFKLLQYLVDCIT